MKKFDVAFSGWVSKVIEAETLDEANEIFLKELAEKYAFEWDDTDSTEVTDD